MERYTALRHVEVVYDREYQLEKYLIGSLKARYDPEPEFKLEPTVREQQQKDGFQEKVAVKDSLQIQLQAKNGTEKTINAIETNKISNTGGTISGEKIGSEFNPRCGYCIGLRLAKTAKYAAQNGFEAFTTTLLESKYQPHEYIRKLGERLANLNGIKFYYRDFRIGWKESIQISKGLQLYRQQYCGCIFSEYERFK